MNEDLAFKRVRIRKVLLPLLKDFNPKIIETLAKTAFLMQQDFAELQEIAQKMANIETASNSEISTERIKRIFPSVRRTILRAVAEK